MLIKWIVCEVPLEKRAAFSQGQEAWAALRGAPGFLGQFGGWDQQGRACVAGLWENEDAYQHFMAELHDPITDKNNQVGTYTASTVTFLKGSLDVTGDIVSHREQLAAITGHIVDCEAAWTVPAK